MAVEPRLEAEFLSGPFRCRPGEGEHDGTDEEHLVPEDFGRGHSDEGSGGLALTCKALQRAAVSEEIAA